MVTRLSMIFFFALWTTMLVAQDAVDPVAPKRWAVIIVGLPGDDDHEQAFRETADQLQSWLIESLRYPADQVLRLPQPAKDEERHKAITAEDVRSLISDVNQKLKPQDSLWVVVLGHGNYDGKQAWFHVKGKDPSNEEFGRWLADVRCQEQVVWMTQSSSGWFVKPLAKPGRIVIAATAADDESNETEFPHALATIAKSPVEKLDLDKDGAVSVAELYTITVAEVLRRFQSDKRLPTEHPQLEDNSDGVGTEEILPQKTTDTEAAARPPNSKRDGDLAKRTLVPYRVPDSAKADSP